MNPAPVSLSACDLGPLPLGYGAGPESKEGMGAGAHDGANGAELSGTAPPQLVE